MSTPIVVGVRHLYASDSAFYSVPKAQMIITKDSHLDHSLTAAQLAHVLALFANRSAFFIETIELPPELGTVSCALYGPLMGDDAVPEHNVTYRKRGTRAWNSRTIEWLPRQTRKLTVIAGPHDGHACVLYTAFGGPLAPKEPGDASITDEQVRDASVAFWAEHALGLEGM